MKSLRGVLRVAVAGLAVACAASLARAGYGPGGGGNLGAGFMLGSPTGFTTKYWVDRKSAIDGSVGWGFDNGVTAVMDYLWHDFSAFPFLKNPETDGKLAFDVGLGGRIQTDGDDNFGVRGVAGLTYFFPKSPFELFAEIAPVLVLVDHPEGDLDGGIGFRYYFR
jgi:hypothetical protein